MISTGNRATADVIIMSWGAKTCLSVPTARYQVDVSQMRDPHSRFTTGDGRLNQVKDWINRDRRVSALIQEMVGIARHHLKLLKDPFITLSFWDHHGRWASVAVAELVADALMDDGITVAVEHHGLS